MVVAVVFSQSNDCSVVGAGRSYAHAMCRGYLSRQVTDLLSWSIIEAALVVPRDERGKTVLQVSTRLVS